MKVYAVGFFPLNGLLQQCSLVVIMSKVDFFTEIPAHAEQQADIYKNFNSARLKIYQGKRTNLLNACKSNLIQ